MADTPMYSVIEDTDDKLVLQTSKASRYLGFVLLFMFGSFFLLGAWEVDNVPVRVVVASVGAVLWVGAILVALEHRRWEFDARSGTLRFTSRLRPKRNFVVSTNEILRTEVKYQKVMGESYRASGSVRTATHNVSVHALYLVLQDGRRFMLNKARSWELIDKLSRRITGQSPQFVGDKAPKRPRSRGGEPFHEGRGLREWIQLLDSNDGMEQHKAGQALAKIGRPALDALIEALTTGGQNARDGAARAIQTMLVFGKLARAGKLEAASALTRMLADSRESARTRAACAASLGQIGPDAKDAVSALRVALKSEDRNLRLQSAVALSAIDPGIIRTTLPVLLEGLRDSSSYVRCDAISGLGSVDSDLEEVVPALVGALKDEDSTCRRKAAYALRDIGARASQATAALDEALKDDDLLVRDAATEALERIRQESST